MKTSAKSNSRKPLEVTAGNVTVKIYSGQNLVNGTLYPQFVLTYKQGTKPGKRPGKTLPVLVRRKFSDLDEAKREAQLVAVKLANGQGEAINLTGADRAAYLDACQSLRPFDVTLTDAISQFVKASDRLKEKKASIAEAVDFFLRRNPANLPQKTVREVVDEMLAAKIKAGKGDKHLADLASRLGSFADAMMMNISLVTSQMIEAHLDGKNVSGRTKQNHLKHIISLFKFCVRKKYLTKDAMDEVTGIEKPTAEQTEIEIFSPDELREILTAARPEIIPWLAISAFAGLRSAELQRLDWKEVDLIGRHIEVTAAKSKTASRRLVPITDNLLAWMKRAKPSGERVTGFENMAKQIGWLVDDVNDRRREQAELDGRNPDDAPKFVWKRNALRHSFVSYRVAAIKDVAQVALEAGNSPAMIFANYRQLVTEQEAAKWFNIVPEAVVVDIIPTAKEEVLQ
jgi:integrase